MMQIEDRAEFLELVPQYFTRSEVHCSFQDCMSDHVQRVRRHSVNEPGEMDLAEQRRDPIPFAGDEDSPVLPISAAAAHTVLNKTETQDEGASKVFDTCGPPVAWVLMWHGKYSNLYGEGIPAEFRSWGYVMWDERRWNGMYGAKRFLLYRWESSFQYDILKEPHGWFRDLP